MLSHFSFDASPHHTLSQCSEKCVKVLVALLCPTLCDPMDCSLPGSLVQWILQARAREWVVPFSRGSSQPKDQTHVSCGSCIAGRFFFLPLSHQGSPICKYKIKITLKFFFLKSWIIEIKSRMMAVKGMREKWGCERNERCCSGVDTFSYEMSGLRAPNVLPNAYSSHSIICFKVA